MKNKVNKLVKKYPETLGGEDIVKIKPGTIMRDEVDWTGVRMLVMRSTANFCGYVGVPKKSPAAGFLGDDIPLQVHGGVTFSSEGGRYKEDPFPKDYWWYGWDYAHSGDEFFFYGRAHEIHKQVSRSVEKSMGKKYQGYKRTMEKVWTLGEVWGEVNDAAYQLHSIEGFTKTMFQIPFMKWFKQKKKDWDRYYFRKWGMKKATKWLKKEQLYRERPWLKSIHRQRKIMRAINIGFMALATFTWIAWFLLPWFPQLRFWMSFGMGSMFVQCMLWLWKGESASKHEVYCKHRGEECGEYEN